MRSIQSRLTLTAILVVGAFMGLTGWSLERAYQRSAETALQDRLQGQIYALLAAADLDANDRLVLPPSLPEPRLGRPDSGLVASVSHKGNIIWRSRSSLGVNIKTPTAPATGQSHFAVAESREGIPYYSLSFTVSWETGGAPQTYVLHVAETRDSFNAQLGRYRTNLWAWLGGATAFLLLSQVLVLRWGLKPLREVADDLDAIEAGKQSTLEGSYPKELMRLTTNINQLLGSAQAQLKRHRDALADLAHSLKTPLSILRTSADNETSVLAGIVREHVTRMRDIVEYQLQRAAAAGRSALATPVAVHAITEKIIDALNKAYADKAVEVVIDIDDAIRFHGNEGDLMEMVGNLAENAFKWCHARVQIGATISGDEDGGHRLSLWVEDDGPGISIDARTAVLERGVRFDENTPGHGIGLAIVREIAQAYGATIEIDESALGGAKLILSGLR